MGRLHTGALQQATTEPFAQGFLLENNNLVGDMQSITADGRYALLGGRNRQQNGNSSTQAVLIDMKDGAILSASPPHNTPPYRLQLANNGLALVWDKEALHIYQFPVQGAAVVVRNDPPKTKEEPAKTEPKFDPFAKTKEEPAKTEPKTKDEPVKAVRAPVPNPEALVEPDKEIRARFKKEYARKAAGDVAALADKLLQLGLETKDDVPARYLLLSEAKDLAIKAGRPALTLRAVQALADTFEIDEGVVKQAAVAALTKSTLSGDYVLELVDAGLGLAGDLMAEDQYDAASKTVLGLMGTAQRTKNLSLLARVQKFDRQIKDMAKEYDDVKKANLQLESDPTNGAASAVAGQFLAFRKGDWNKGLALLAQSNIADVQELAKKDLAKPEAPKARLELGDAWWNAAEKKTTYQKAAMQWRAGYWYRQALPHLTGLTQTKIVDRVKIVDDQPTPFRIADPLGEVQRLKGHTAAITALSLSADGKRLHTSSMDGMIREWNLGTGKSKVVLNTHAPIHYFAFAPDEKNVAIGSTSGIRVWDMFTFKPHRSWDTEREALPNVTWSSNSSVRYLSRQNYWTMNLAGGGSGNAGQANARAVIYSPNGERAIDLCEDGKNEVFRVMGSGRNVVGTVNLNATAAAFSYDNKLMVLAGKDRTLHLYDVSSVTNNMFNPSVNFSEIKTLKGHTGPIRCVTFSPNGKQILSGGDDKTVKVWDVAAGNELHSYNLHTGTMPRGGHYSRQPLWHLGQYGRDDSNVELAEVKASLPLLIQLPPAQCFVAGCGIRGIAIIGDGQPVDPRTVAQEGTTGLSRGAVPDHDFRTQNLIERHEHGAVAGSGQEEEFFGWGRTSADLVFLKIQNGQGCLVLPHSQTAFAVAGDYHAQAFAFVLGEQHPSRDVVPQQAVIRIRQQ